MTIKTYSFGFSLIELLVTLVIVSVGVLGVASLQIQSLQQNREAFFRAEATYLANGLIDRIRANPLQVYTLPIAQAPVAAGSCVLANCTSAEMAGYDLAEWQCSIRSVNQAGATYAACAQLGVTGALPLGSGRVTQLLATATTRLYEVEVQWSADSNATICGSRAGSDPVCQSIVVQSSL